MALSSRQLQEIWEKTLSELARTIAREVLDHIRTDDKTPEQGIADYELGGELAAEVLALVYEMDAGVTR